MNAAEPSPVAAAHRAFSDVEATIATSGDELSALRSIVVTEFAGRLLDLEVPAGFTFAEVAEAVADIAIEKWCRQRRDMVRMIVGALHPDTVVLAQMVGMAPQLGDLIGLHLDNAIRDLDAELRETIADAEAARG